MPVCSRLETDLHIRKEETASSFAKLSGQKERLLEKLLDGIISDADYQKKERELQNKIESLRDTMALFSFSRFADSSSTSILSRFLLSSGGRSGNTDCRTIRTQVFL